MRISIFLSCNLPSKSVINLIANLTLLSQNLLLYKRLNLNKNNLQLLIFL